MKKENILLFHQLLPDNVGAKYGTHFFNEHFIRKGCRVLNLAPVVSFPGLLNPFNIKERLQRISKYLGGPRIIEEPGIGEYALFGLALPFITSSNLWFMNSYFVEKNFFRYTYPAIKKILHSWGQPDILFFDVTSNPIYYQVKPKLSIFRVQDYLDRPLWRLDSPSRRDLIKNVDVIIAVSQSLYDMVVTLRCGSEGVYLLPNGCDINKFLLHYPQPIEYENIPKPIALYVGGLHLDAFDWDLLNNVAMQKRDMSFVIIGHGSIPNNSAKNIYFLGSRPHDKLPAYMQNANIGLIPLRDTAHIRAVERPLKFYQYIASGLPVVSVDYGSMKAMSPYAILANNAEEFSLGIEEALKYDESQRNLLRQAAMQFSWSNVFKRFDEIIAAHYPGWLIEDKY